MLLTHRARIADQREGVEPGMGANSREQAQYLHSLGRLARHEPDVLDLAFVAGFEDDRRVDLRSFRPDALADLDDRALDALAGKHDRAAEDRLLLLAGGERDDRDRRSEFGAFCDL